MTEPTQDSVTISITALLLHYGFELGGHKAEDLIDQWLNDYDANWVRLAVVEALYQGRYKAVSVEQILGFWLRRCRPLYHFNHEFERLIFQKIPQILRLRYGATGAKYEDSDELQDAKATTEPSFSPLVWTLWNDLESGVITQETIVDVSDTQDFDEPEIIETPPSLSMARHESLKTNPDAIASITSESTFLETVPNGEQIISIAEIAEEEEEQDTDSTDSSTTNINYKPDWYRWQATKQPIHQFTPLPDVSHFYLKLKAVAHPQEESLPEISPQTDDVRNNS